MMDSLFFQLTYCIIDYFSGIWYNDLRALTSYLCFASWDDLITFMLRSFEPGRVVPVRLEPPPIPPKLDRFQYAPS